MIAINLVACGGGGSGNDTVVTDPDPANNCVSFPIPTVGRTTTTLEEVFGSSQTSTQTVKTITAKTDTSISSKSEHRYTKDTINYEDKKTSTIEFVMSDDYMDIGKSNSKTETFTVAANTSARLPNDAPLPINDDPILAPPEVADDDGIVNSKKVFTTTTDNPNRKAINKVCENQSWTTSYTVKDNQTNGAGQLIRNTTQTVDEIFTVESINQQQTVVAGTFTTYQLKVEDGTTVTTKWIDTNTGVLVKSTKKQTDGTSLESSELQKTEVVLLDLITPITPPSEVNSL